MNPIQLAELSIKELHARYERHLGKTTKSRNKPWLIKQILAAAEKANDKQSSEDAPQSQAADEPAPEAEPTKAVLATGLAIGTVITKTYKGRDIRMTICAEGFEVDGTMHKSLSGAAKAIAGCNWNGYVFFGLKKNTTTKTNGGQS
jgi:hypothetical protein